MCPSEGRAAVGTCCSQSTATHQARSGYLDADALEGDFRPIDARRNEIEYFLEHAYGACRISEQTKVAAISGCCALPQAILHPRTASRLLRTGPVSRSNEWTRSRIIWFFSNARTRFRLRVADPDGGTDYTVAFEQAVYAIHPEGNAEYRTTRFRFVYSSPIEPRAVFDYDMNTGERELKKRDVVLGGFDSGNYETERIFALAPDGVRVPISLAYRKDGRQCGLASPLSLRLWRNTAS